MLSWAHDYPTFLLAALGVGIAGQWRRLHAAGEGNQQSCDRQALPHEQSLPHNYLPGWVTTANTENIAPPHVRSQHQRDPFSSRCLPLETGMDVVV